jgi:hypothetical protein
MRQHIGMQKLQYLKMRLCSGPLISGGSAKDIRKI